MSISPWTARTATAGCVLEDRCRVRRRTAPETFATRAEWLSQFDDEFDDGMDAAWLHDPTGVAPRLSLLQVPEPKTAKNGLHPDLRVSGDGTPEQRWSCVMTEVARLGAAGAATLQECTGHRVVMVDPEGNEFCVA